MTAAAIRRAPDPTAIGSGRPNFIQQVGMAVQQMEELDQRQRRASLAVLVARERVDAAAEQRGGLALVQRQIFADAGDKPM